MSYAKYEEDVVQEYRVALEGWPFGEIAPLNTVSNSLPPLRKLRDALISGTCKWVHLTDAELREREMRIEEEVAAGLRVATKGRKKRSDAGITRGPNILTIKRKASDTMESAARKRNNTASPISSTPAPAVSLTTSGLGSESEVPSHDHPLPVTQPVSELSANLGSHPGITTGSTACTSREYFMPFPQDATAHSAAVFNPRVPTPGPSTVYAHGRSDAENRDFLSTTPSMYYGAQASASMSFPSPMTAYPIPQPDASQSSTSASVFPELSSTPLPTVPQNLGGRPQQYPMMDYAQFLQHQIASTAARTGNSG